MTKNDVLEQKAWRAEDTQKFPEWATYLLKIMVHAVIEVKENFLIYRTVYNRFEVNYHLFLRRTRAKFWTHWMCKCENNVTKSLYFFCLF